MDRDAVQEEAVMPRRVTRAAAQSPNSTARAAFSGKNCWPFPLARGDLAKARDGPERRRVRFHDLHLVHAGVRGTAPACRAEHLDGVRRTGEESLDIAVQAISYPAPNAG